MYSGDYPILYFAESFAGMWEVWVSGVYLGSFRGTVRGGSTSENQTLLAIHFTPVSGSTARSVEVTSNSLEVSENQLVDCRKTAGQFGVSENQLVDCRNMAGQFGGV